MMNDNLKRAGLTLLIIICTVLSVAYVKNLADNQVVKIIRVPDPNYVQNPYEAQERLKAQGLYDGKIDGIWGKKTDEAYCNWCAIREMKKINNYLDILQ